jgi:hypothetical protein
MTRDQQIDAAVKLLVPPFRDRPMWRERVDERLGLIDEAKANTEEHKAFKSNVKPLKQHMTALRRVLTTYDALDASTQQWFLLATDIIAHDMGEAEALLHSQDRRDNKRPSRRGKEKAMMAVGMAYFLLKMRGHQPMATRGGKWDQLSKILANTSADMLDYLREAKTRIAVLDGARRRKTAKLSDGLTF